MNRYYFHNPVVRAFVMLLLAISVQSCANADNSKSELSAHETIPTTAAQPVPPTVEHIADVEDPPPLSNLNLDSDSLMVLQKIRWSHTTWHTLWAEGLDRWMSPEGSGTVQGEIRSQAWVSQAGPSLREMYGTNDEGPTYMQIMDGFSVLRMDPGGGFREISKAPEFVLFPYVPATGVPAEEARHPLGRILQTALANLLFPFPVSTEEATFKGIEIEAIAGRQALVVDVYVDDEVRTDRLWVDVERGILLRRQHFGRGGSEQPLSDIQLTAVVYDPPIPQGCFSLSIEDIPGFEEPPTAGGPETPTNGSVEVIPGTEVVNLRSGPGTDFDVMGQLNEGVIVPVIGMTALRDWWQLSFDGGPAWVYAPLVEFTGDPSMVPVVDGRIPVLVPSSDIDFDRATEVIDAFMGMSNMHLLLVEGSAMPNANLRPGWKLIDDSGRLYWLDVETYQLVQIEPFPLISVDTTGPKSIEELRQIARQFAEEHSAQFAELEEELTYSEGDKLGLRFFFQWEDRSRLWSFMPPMLQVGLTSDGQVFSWLNTLDLSK
jgi:hypothetical protein